MGPDETTAITKQAITKPRSDCQTFPIKFLIKLILARFFHTKDPAMHNFFIFKLSSEILSLSIMKILTVKNQRNVCKFANFLWFSFSSLKEVYFVKLCFKIKLVYPIEIDWDELGADLVRYFHKKMGPLHEND